MSVRVRMAPSPTGFLHIGGVRTFLFNWLFARGNGGEILLRIENTDTSREVAEATEQIQSSLRWLGIDWDGPVQFQLDTAERARELARELVAAGHAYEDEGAIRFRQPKEGSVSWDDAVRGRIEFQNDQLSDLVIVRSDGRPTYNFISPVDDVQDRITHVIRGEDHVSNTPSQINILRALGADLPVYAHLPNILGNDGRKLSKRRQAVSLDDFRAQGYYAPALMNFLALLGWSYDDHTTVMLRHELIERFSLDRVAEPGNARHAEARLAERRLPAQSPAGRVRASALPLARRTWHRLAPRPRSRDGAARAGEDRALRRLPGLREASSSSPFRPTGPIRGTCEAALEKLSAVEPWAAATIEAALRALADELEEKPRVAFQPIRLAVTGSKISPGLFE